MQITVNISDTFEFRRAKQVFQVDATTIPTSIFEDIIYHGFTQKIGDAAAGKDGDDAGLAMLKVYESLQKGNWGRERSVSTGPAWMPYAIAIVRGKLGAANKAAYAAIPSDDQKARTDFLRGLFDGLGDDMRDRIQAAAELELEEARAKAARAKAIAVDSI